MKRLSLYLFLVLFTLQTPSQADDIRDFQIEGISIGDSLLDYMSKDELANLMKSYYPNKKNFAGIFLQLSSYEIYERVGVDYDAESDEYKIHSIQGFLYFKNNIKNCYKQKKEVVSELAKTIGNDVETNTYKSNHAYDKSGKSKTRITDYYFKSGAQIRVMCLDWSPEITTKTGWEDQMQVVVNSKEFTNFLQNEAYK